MLDFVAIGPTPDQRWRRRLPEGQTVRLGRAPLQGWAVPWDLRISREHVDLRLVGERLEVRCLETARNPVYRLEQPARRFEIGPGEDFRIGATTFRLERIAAETPPAPVEASGGGAAAPEVESLKAQVAALQSQLTAYADARQREQASEPAQSDDEVEQLRAQVVALKEQVTMQRRPADEKDRQIAELQAQIEALRGAGRETASPNATPPDAALPHATTPNPEAAASPPPAAKPEGPAKPNTQAETPARARAAEKPDVEALKARLEEKAAAKRKQRQEPLSPPPVGDSSDAAAPRNGAKQAAEAGPAAPERKSTLFVLKAQIEAQAAKLRREGKSAEAIRQETIRRDSRQSDVEALKALLEARAAEQAQARSERARSDSSRRSSHITALLALHDARSAARMTAAEREAAERKAVEEYDADRSSLDDNSDETDEPVLIEPLDEDRDPSDDTECWAGSLIARAWRELPGDVQEIVREIASGFVVDETAQARVVTALNRLLVSRGFLNESELQDALHAVAGEERAGEGRYSEAELRRAARFALAGVLPGLPARKPASAEVAARLGRGECFGMTEIITGRVLGATYVAAFAAPECGVPVEMVRIDAGSLMQLRETSSEFRAAWERAAR